MTSAVGLIRKPFTRIRRATANTCQRKDTNVTTAIHNPDTLLPRKAISAVLTEAGFKTSAATLATYATRGGGPEYVKYGRTPLYRVAAALSWAQGRLSAPMHSTSEADARRVAA